MGRKGLKSRFEGTEKTLAKSPVLSQGTSSDHTNEVHPTGGQGPL